VVVELGTRNYEESGLVFVIMYKAKSIHVQGVSNNWYPAGVLSRVPVSELARVKLV
jgi:hypothetical protein